MSSWRVTKELGAAEGLHNPCSGLTPPTQGWRHCHPSDGKWRDVPELMLSSKAVSCDSIIVTGKGKVAGKYKKFFGTFRKTDEWRLGRPVFANDHGCYLYYFQCYWRLGDDVGDLGRLWTAGVAPSICPAQSDSWETGIAEKVEITVSCCDHLGKVKMEKRRTIKAKENKPERNAQWKSKKVSKNGKCGKNTDRSSKNQYQKETSEEDPNQDDGVNMANNSQAVEALEGVLAGMGGGACLGGKVDDENEIVENNEDEENEEDDEEDEKDDDHVEDEDEEEEEEEEEED